MRCHRLLAPTYLALLTATSRATHAGASTSTSTSTANTACACNQLKKQFPDLVLTSNSPNYTAERTDYWDVRSDLHPTCIFLPTQATQVADGVRILNRCDAQFAIRGGGHMNYPGSNNIDGGVLLALNGLTHLQYLESKETIEIGPGNRWVDVYDALDPYQRYAIGGRLKTIGVPGLSLIGGVNYFANKYGFTMDNVVGYDVVLGNGSQVVANAASHPDLFWALKGGANNFGIVTKFTFRTYHIPKISTTIQAFNESAIPAFIQATCDLAENDGPDLAAGAVITIQYNATTKVASASLLGVQEGTESPPSRFNAFSEIPATTRQNNVTTPKAWHSALDTPFQMFRVAFAHHTMKPEADRLLQIYQAWKDAVDSIADVEGLYPTFAINLAPKSAAAVAKNNGVGNVWGLEDDQSYLWWQLSTGWARARDDLRMTAWIRSFVEHHHEVNRALGIATEFLYMGDAGEHQDPFRGFAPDNVQKMKDVRADYDPDGVFTRLNWGGFKLGF